MLKDRNVILHVHIFKNAGSSFDDTLLSNFNNEFIDHREDHLIRNDHNFLKNYLTEHKSIKAFSSHSVYHTPRDFDEVKLHAVYFLRHPIERIKSVYSFEKKQPVKDSSGAKMAKELNFQEYVSWRMEEHAPATIRNLQTIFLAGQGVNHKKSINQLYQFAFKNLMGSPLVGVVDRYDESMVIFEEHLKQFFPQIDLSYIRRNVTDTDTSASVEEKVEKLLQQLDLPLQKLVKEKNEFDLELYARANSLLDDKIASISNFQIKLDNFKDRCILKQVNYKIKQKDYSGVVRFLNPIIQKGTNSVQLYLSLANAQKELKEYNKALDVYEKTMKKFPNNPWAYFYQAETYNLIGSEAKSKELFKLYKLKFNDKIKVIDYFQKQQG